MHTPAESVTLRFLAAPTDAGYTGTVGAGRVLEWIDKAGYAAAAGWGHTYAVTAYVGNVRFTRPIPVGHMVEARARIVLTGRSSMHIRVTVASGDPREGRLEPATDCLMVFVAMDADRRPTPVDQFRPDSDDERELESSAARRVGLRRQIEEAMAEQTYSDAGTAPRIVLRFLAAPTDINWGGKVHGGIVMRWIDEAAHVLATRWTGNASTVAVYTGGVRFYRPLQIGHLVEVEARLLLTGTSSMHISVHVRSGDPTTGALEETTHCLTIFVALDEDGRTVPVPAWAPASDEDAALAAHARHLVELRTAVDAVS
ncbi:acyl-CoA thioesterase [Agilicoccus flavus]|uniref:acyl-CoA thioesterase n=1 Tax=Agilicoccus flavus TaxID=2775968 RepID=UPI001CF7092C|nr:acyl-CoA thioesterase [Agilicoccus flavus]